MTFTNSTDVIVTYVLDGNDGNNAIIELNGTIKGPLVIKFLNSVYSSSFGLFGLFGLLDGYKIIKVKTYTSIV